jgi:uncharacterized membrane protein YhaH (DUF805 family)
LSSNPINLSAAYSRGYVALSVFRATRKIAMLNLRYKVTSTGKLMPGVDQRDALENLAQLFKSDVGKMVSLLKRPVTLKRNLSESDADRYIQVLQQAGVYALKEEDLASMLTLVVEEPVEKDSGPPPLMKCPKCAHEQPKNNECTECGIIIDKYIAYQSRLAAEPSSSIEISQPSPYAPPQAELGLERADYAKLSALSLKGRIGRLRFLAWSLGASAVILITFLIIFLAIGISFTAGLSSMGASISVSLVLGLAILLVTLSIGVKRLHDLGWSGWLWLLTLIPVLGGIFSLLLIVLPGSPATNRYGPPPPPNSTAVKLLAGCWLVVVLIMIITAVANPH